MYNTSAEEYLVEELKALSKVYKSLEDVDMDVTAASVHADLNRILKTYKEMP